MQGYRINMILELRLLQRIRNGFGLQWHTGFNLARSLSLSKPLPTPFIKTKLEIRRVQWTVGTCSHVTKKQGLNKTSLLTSVNIAGKYCTTCCLAEEFQIYTDTKLIHFHSKKNSRDRSALPLKWSYLIPNIIQTHLKEEQGRKTRRPSKNVITKQCHQYTLFSATDFQSATMKLFLN